MGVEWVFWDWEKRDSILFCNILWKFKCTVTFQEFYHDYPYTHKLDSAINILLYLLLLYHTSMHLHPSISVIFWCISKQIADISACFPKYFGIHIMKEFSICFLFSFEIEFPSKKFTNMYVSWMLTLTYLYTSPHQETNITIIPENSFVPLPNQCLPHSSEAATVLISFRQRLIVLVLKLDVNGPKSLDFLV